MLSPTEFLAGVSVARGIASTYAWVPTAATEPSAGFVCSGGSTTAGLSPSEVARETGDTTDRSPSFSRRGAAAAAEVAGVVVSG